MNPYPKEPFALSEMMQWAQRLIAALRLRTVWTGYVSSDAATVDLPGQWTASKIATGQYRVTHSLGLTATGYHANATTRGSGATVHYVDHGANSFDVFTKDFTGAAADAAIGFQMRRNGGG